MGVHPHHTVHHASLCLELSTLVASVAAHVDTAVRSHAQFLSARHEIRLEFFSLVSELERSLAVDAGSGSDPRGPPACESETASDDVSSPALVRSVDRLLSKMSTIETVHYATMATVHGTGVLAVRGLRDQVDAIVGSGNVARIRGRVEEVMRRVDGIPTGRSDGGGGGSRGGRREKDLQAGGAGVGTGAGEGLGLGQTRPETLGKRRAKAMFPNLRAMLEKKYLLDCMCWDYAGDGDE
ncbi:hypothetical protein HDU93_002827 [Gonapodya sp. JEL0774]|nr:hypothetical protein HDU93_002827 [Gonapodya sp. JEL0774]